MSQALFHTLLAQPVTGYDADYQAVLTQATALGYTLPDASNITIQNQFVLDLKAAGIWTGLDIFYPMLTNINFATLNWKAPTLFQLTLVNSPTYNSSTGFAGNGTTSYLNTGWKPATNGVNYTQNDASFGGLNANNVNDSSALFGATASAGGNASYLLPRSAGTLITRINQSVSSTVANGNSIGRYHVQRTASNALDILKNGSSLTTGATGSATRTTRDVYVCANNSNGVAANFSTRQIRYLWLGASLDTLEATFDGTLASFYP